MLRSVRSGKIKGGELLRLFDLDYKIMDPQPALGYHRRMRGYVLLALLPVLSFSGPNLTQDLKVPEGLEVTAWASSPMFYNPTGMSADYRGRIWVSEAVNYRDFRNLEKKPHWHEAGDRIMILEDSNGDGVADHSKVFVQDKDLE